MSQAQHQNQIYYIEMSVKDIGASKRFYETVFGWKFEDYGPEYTSFFDGRLAGGFRAQKSTPVQGLLLVIYARDLVASQKKIKEAGGKIAKDIFAFPSGGPFPLLGSNRNATGAWARPT